MRCVVRVLGTDSEHENKRNNKTKKMQLKELQVLVVNFPSLEWLISSPLLALKW